MATWIPIFDPFSTFVDASGNTMRNPIPGNIIPAARLNKIAQAFDKYFPAPNQPGDPFTRVNNWFAQGSTPSASNKADAKIDHNISEKQRLSARYGVNWGWNGVANLTGNISHNGNPGFNRFQNFIVDYTRTHSPTTVFTARAGVLRAKSVRDPLSFGFDAVKELGVSPLFQAAGVSGVPDTTAPRAYRAMGAGGFAIIHRFEDVYQILGVDDQDSRRPHHQGRRRIPQVSRELLPAEYAEWKSDFQPQPDRAESAGVQLDPG